jgi:TonB family protein
MIAIWMIYVLALGLLLGLAAHALERVASLWGWPRRFVWAAAILASLLVPLAALMRPPVPAPRAEPLPKAVATVAPVREMPSGAGTVTLNKVAPVLAAVNRPLLLLWCGASLLLVFRLLRSGISLRRRAGSWRAMVVDETRVLIAPDIGPAVVRLGGLKIVLPDWALSAEPLARSLMLQHEREHCRTRDPDLLLGATVVLVLSPWNLPLWWQVHRLQLAVETDCDRRVIRAGAEAQAYGGLLLRVGARHTRQPLLAATAFSETPSLLERRILAMTTPRPANPIVRAALATCIAVLGVAAACMTPRPAPAPTQRPAVAPAPEPALASRELPAGVYREQDVTDRPERVGGPPPRYPDSLRTAGVGGRVLVEFIVDTAGHVEPGSVRILSSTHPGFEAPTRDAIVASTFRPGLVQGHVVPVVLRQPVNYEVARGPDSAYRLPTGNALVRDGVQALRAQDYARADSLLGLAQQGTGGKELQAVMFYHGLAQFQRAFAAMADARSKARDAERDPAVKAAACASVAVAGNLLNQAEPNIADGAVSSPDMANQLLKSIPEMRNSLPQLARVLHCPS